MKRDSFEWPASWPRMTGANTRMLLIGMCIKADAQGELVRTRKELASFPGASVATIDSCIDTLELTDCLLVIKPGRDEMGSFGANRYVLRLENPKMRSMFEFWGPVARRSLEQSRKSASSGKNGREGLYPPATSFGAPLPETSPRPYKDSRASSSSSSILPSFPENGVVGDKILRGRVSQAWHALGEGVDPDRVHDLVRSLAIEIPKAIAEGYDFDEEILPCLQEATNYYRSHRLWSFKVVFERDLPRFRRQLRRNVG